MPTTTKSRPRRGKQARRDEILNAAVKLFAERGYRATTVEDIMDTFGATGAAFYYYFKGKEALLEAIFDDAMTLVETELEQTLVLGLQPDEAIERIVRTHATVVLSNPYLCAVMFSDGREITPALAKKVAARESAYTAAVTDVYRSGAEQGVLADQDPELVIDAILGMANWSYRWYRATKHPSVDEVGSALGQMALRIIRSSRRSRGRS